MCRKLPMHGCTEGAYRRMGGVYRLGLHPLAPLVVLGLILNENVSLKLSTIEIAYHGNIEFLFDYRHRIILLYISKSYRTRFPRLEDTRYKLLVLDNLLVIVYSVSASE